MKRSGIKQRLGGGVVLCGLLGTGLPGGFAETCTTQSQMTPSDRTSLEAAATELAGRVQASDEAGLRALTIPEYAKDFGGIAEAVGNAARRLKGGSAAVEQVYLLDASMLKSGPDGASPDAQFFCSLNRSPAEAQFTIPALPPGRYAFAMVRVENAAPWDLSFLLRQDSGKWMLAGFYPKADTAAGHDGLWYWTQARALTAQKQPWNAWLYYQQAQQLLQPAGFVSSTNLEKLRTELTAAAPPPVAQGLSVDAPLVVKAQDGKEYRVSALTVENAPGQDQVDVAVHMTVDPVSDAQLARKRNIAAMSAVLAAYPELRKPFHGMWVFAEVKGQSAVPTELAMQEIP